MTYAFLTISLMLLFACVWLYRKLRQVERKIAGGVSSAEINDHRLKAVFRNAPAEIYLKDNEGRYVMINPQFEKLFDVRNEDIVGLLPTDVHDPELGARTRAHDLSVLDSKETVVRDELAMTEMGLRTLHTIKFPTFDDNGALTGLGAIVTDVTDLRASENKLRETQKMEAIGQLTGGVAHDFNNILAVILGNLELFAEVKDPREKQDCVNEAIAATKRASDLTCSLLSFVGQSPMVPTTNDLNKVIPDIINWVSRTLPSNISIDATFSASEALVEVDVSLLETALLNLFINARDAMPDGGKILIRVSQEQADPRQSEAAGHILVEVSDTGHGIDDTVQNDIYSPFFSTKPKGLGSGLGLSMVKGFMQQSHGHIELAETDNTGTTFKLWFPKTQSHAHDAVDVTPRKSVGPRAAQARILVAEDDESVRTYLTRCLKTLGAEVLAEGDGDSAFARFLSEDGKIDLLVTDVLMPGHVQGPTLARKITEIRPDIPVIYLSGYPQERSGRSLEILPSETYLLKPVSAAALREAVRSSLG